MSWKPQVSLADFKAQVLVEAQHVDCPGATEIQKNIPIYDGAKVTEAIASEWANVLLDGAGVFVVRGAYADTTVIDEATAVFREIIAEEKEAVSHRGRAFRALLDALRMVGTRG